MPADPLLAAARQPAAVLRLQRAAGNRAATPVLARHAAPAASGGELLVEFLNDLWQEEPASIVRLGLEVFRPIPLFGGIPGAVADLIAAGQDVTSVPFGNPAERGISVGNVAYSSVVELTIGARSLVNIANNAVGALLTVPQFAAGLGIGATGGELASGVAAPAAVPAAAGTAAAMAAAEVLGALKLELATATGIFDGLITLEAGAGALAFPDDSKEWLDLMTNYIGNVVGDAFGLFNDAIGRVHARAVAER